MKKDGLDRHWAGSGRIVIGRDAVDEYKSTVGVEQLDGARFVVGDIPDTDPSLFHDVENRSSGRKDSL